MCNTALIREVSGEFLAFNSVKECFEEYYLKNIIVQFPYFVIIVQFCKK